MRSKPENTVTRDAVRLLDPTDVLGIPVAKGMIRTGVARGENVCLLRTNLGLTPTDNDKSRASAGGTRSNPGADQPRISPISPETPVLPAGERLRKRERHVTQADLEVMLAALDLGKNTRISIARSFGIMDYINDGEDVRRLVELGGFIVQGPIAVAELLRRYGPGEYRVSAYAFDPPGLLWEVLSPIRSRDPVATAAETAQRK